MAVTVRRTGVKCEVVDLWQCWVSSGMGVVPRLEGQVFKPAVLFSETVGGSSEGSHAMGREGKDYNSPKLGAQNHGPCDRRHFQKNKAYRRSWPLSLGFTERLQ